MNFYLMGPTNGIHSVGVLRWNVKYVVQATSIFIGHTTTPFSNPSLFHPYTSPDIYSICNVIWVECNMVKCFTEARLAITSQNGVK